MATNLTNTTFSSTYKDDFRDSDNYHRILFNSGRALQARELTQMQTIAHRELRRFGSNIFVDGGVVEPGGTHVNNRLEFIKLSSNVITDGTFTQSEILNKTFTVQAPAAALQVKVVKIALAEGANPDTLFVEYVSSTAGTSSSDPIRVGNSETLARNDAPSVTFTSASSSASGAGTEVSIQQGVFYVQGHFVFAEKQTIFVDKYSGTPDAEIGFKVVEQVITADDDIGLFDNQGAAPNIAAPGADRYRIKLLLSKKSDILASENFVYVARITNGRISDENRVDNSYKTINDILALRTREESGNYSVKSFTAAFNSLDSAAVSSNLQLEMSDGIVYVDGYRLEAEAKKITIPKARDTLAVENEIVVATYGNFVKGDVNRGQMQGLPEIGTFDKLDLMDGAAYTGNKIGTARVRHVEVDTGLAYRFYLFDIRMNPGKSFSLTKSFGKSVSDYVNVKLEGGAAILKNTSDNNLLFPLPRTRPAETGMTVDAITVQKKISVATDALGQATAVTPPTGYNTFTSTNQWIFADSSVDSSVSITLAGDGTTFDISGAPHSTTLEGLVHVVKSSPTARAKTLREETKSWTWPADAESDGNGLAWLTLNRADIYNVKSIKITDSDGSSLRSAFTVDNGQRDNFYGIGRLVKKASSSIVDDTVIFSRYEYFEHNQNGDFFNITSYPAGVPYEKIPSHILSDGTTVSLRDVIDFRPRAVKDTSDSAITNISFDSDGELTGAAPIINAIPPNTSTFSVDTTYYLPRKDRVIATTINRDGDRIRSGEVRVVQGISSLNPQVPPIPSGAMPLYEYELNPYTLSDSDLTSRIIPSKRFQMKDIAALETRVNQIQETTLLSLLEANTSSLTVLDSAGLERTKAGFMVDNFKDFNFVGTDLVDDVRGAIDRLGRVLQPTGFPHNTRIFYDSSTSTTGRKGDLVLLPINSDVKIVDQLLATETENINPFAVVVSNGQISLSPQSDEWVEKKYVPDRLIDNGTEIRRFSFSLALIRAGQASGIINSWIGKNITEELGFVMVGDNTNIRRNEFFRREQIGDRLLFVESIPFMRSRKIFFKVEGLRPFIRHYMYFGGVEVSDYIRSESEFKRFAVRDDDAGSRFTVATSHPEGASAVTTDALGTMIGSFQIPANAGLKFRTGTTLVQFMDVTGGNRDGATSYSETVFTSTGILETRQRDILNTRIDIRPSIRWYDPLAQSFRVDPAENPNGVHITKVDAFFQTKDDAIPVQCQLRVVQNGSPTDRPIPGGVTFLPPSQVNIPSDLTDMATIAATPTTFTFEEPVFLEANQEYAVVFLADTINYNVYVAKTYEFIIGSTEARVVKQPTMGTLFLSQNGITWTPDQTRDLMFSLYRAEFDASGTAFLRNTEIGLESLVPDPITTDSASSTVRIAHEGHGFIKNDFVTLSGLDSATSYGGLSGASIMGSRQIVNVDHTGYTITADSSATSSLAVGGSNVLASHNVMYDYFVPQVQTLTPDLTDIVASAKKTTGSSFANGRNTAISGAYSKDPAYDFITLNDVNFNEKPYIIATGTNEAVSALSGNKSLEVRLQLSTNDTKVSPIIDLQRASFGTFENVIDDQDSSSTTLKNIPLSIIRETQPQFGTSAAKHTTSVIALEEPAVGLKILLSANRPSAAGIDVYFRTGTSDTILDEVGFTYLPEDGNNPSDEDPGVFRQYEYLAGGVGGFLDTFTQFQVKIVMRSSNSSKPPIIRDLRAIALVT
jgi:hypothetical protein